jgi:hypothetical protein
MLLPAGTYDFEVISAEDKISSKGNPMMEVKLKIWTSTGAVRMVTDYLMESMGFKLIHFAGEIGMAAEYMNGNLDPQDVVGKCGKVQLRVDEADGNFPPKNSVKDYGEPKPKAPKAKPSEMKVEKEKIKPKEPAVFDPADDVPF